MKVHCPKSLLSSLVYLCPSIGLSPREERKEGTGIFVYKLELKTNLCYLHYAHFQIPNKFQSISDHNFKHSWHKNPFHFSEAHHQLSFGITVQTNRKKKMLITVSPMYIHTACSFRLFKTYTKA